MIPFRVREILRLLFWKKRKPDEIAIPSGPKLCVQQVKRTIRETGFVDRARRQRFG
jgi:hypothetical protein